MANCWQYLVAKNVFAFTCNSLTLSPTPTWRSQAEAVPEGGATRTLPAQAGRVGAIIWEKGILQTTWMSLLLLANGVIPLRPGVRRLLDEARTQAVRLAIATTSALPNATALLERTLDPSWFEVIAAGDIVPAKKPAPDIYEYVLAKMGLTPGECLVFEDSQHGLQAAHKAGLKTVVTVNDYTRGQDFADAILLLNHLGEPEQPFTVLAGEVPDDASYLDMALMRRCLEGSAISAMAN